MSSTIEDILYEVITLNVREEFEANIKLINNSGKHLYTPLSSKYSIALYMIYNSDYEL